MNSVDLVAKLLASENLTIVRNNCKTAFFDIKNRVLSLPLWKDMTPEMEGMLVAHEVGHALYTTEEYIEDAKKDRVLAGYINIVEDARVEKLMKRKFPGIRKTFNFGYKQLMDRDFFELKDQDLDKLLLIDRINLYFKAGFNCGVKFTKAEKVLVDRVERAETMQEVLQLAQELFEFTKAERDKFKLDLEELKNDAAKERAEDSDEWDFGGEPSDEELEQGQENEFNERDHSFETPIYNHDIQDDLASRTDTKLQEKLEELADDSIQYKYWTLNNEHAIDPVIPFKRVIRETAVIEQNFAEYDPDHKANFAKFLTESEKVVNYLVKEFEMRKSAQAYKRAKVAKSGSLNLNKLYASKLSDDIFKRITTIPNGKNHGMIFLLDWSGSMHDVIIQTVKQVINLCMFCRRIQIPFEVYAFSGCYNGRHRSQDEFDKMKIWNQSMRDRSTNVLYTDGHYALLQLFSNKMTNAEFNTVARRFTTHIIGYAPGYSLGDTPLNDALVYMTKYIPQFKKQYGVEKLTFITLTDGQSCQLDSSSSLSERAMGIGKYVKVKHFLRDAKSGSDYEISLDACKQTEVMLRLIRDQNECKVLGFYICKNQVRYLREVFSDHYGYSRDRNDDLALAQMRRDFKEHGFSSLKNTGRDDLFVIPSSSTDIVDDTVLDSVNGDLSAAMIARKFGKMFNAKKHSRVLLDRFIGYVA